MKLQNIKTLIHGSVILGSAILLSSCGSVADRQPSPTQASSRIFSESICPRATEVTEAEWLARPTGYGVGEERRFLNENRNRDGVVELSNGLQYKALSNGCGAQPNLNSETVVRYHATLLDGTVFDSSLLRNEANKIPLARVIPGWRQALTLMRPGAIWEVYVPSNLGYGAVATGPIPANSALIFTIELISFE